MLLSLPLVFNMDELMEGNLDLFQMLWSFMLLNVFICLHRWGLHILMLQAVGRMAWSPCAELFGCVA